MNFISDVVIEKSLLHVASIFLPLHLILYATVSETPLEIYLIYMLVFVSAGESFLYKCINNSLLANISLLYLLFSDSALIVISNNSERDESRLSSGFNS